MRPRFPRAPSHCRTEIMKNLPGAGTFQVNTSVNLSLSFMLPACTKSSSLEGSTFRTKACLLSEGTWTESPTLGSFLLLAVYRQNRSLQPIVDILIHVKQENIIDGSKPLSVDKQ